MAAGALGTAMALVMFGLATRPAIAFAASVIAGLSWIAVLATLNVSAQVALPEWVRGRGLAAYMTVMFGALSVGSLAWGQVAAWIGLADAHYIAAAGVLVAAVVLHKRKLQSGAALDLTPSAHWPEPVVSTEVAPDRGPVLVTVEYRVDSGDHDAFVAALRRYGLERRRDGAYAWGLFQDVADPGHWIETFVVDSWLEHLRQHDRVTNADRLVEETVRRYHVGDAPRVTHYIGVRE
jgi:MFS family permease